MKPINEWPRPDGMADKLTPEQIEAAAKTVCSIAGFDWKMLSEQSRGTWRLYVHAAAPFLQVPWNTPTKEEELQIIKDIQECGLNGSLFEIVERFVRRRNAVLMPKPVDPRREKLNRLFRKRPIIQGISQDEYIDVILAALDAKECDHVWMARIGQTDTCGKCFAERSKE